MKFQIFFLMHLISCMFCLKSRQAETQMDTHASLCALGLWISKFHVDFCLAGLTQFTLFCQCWIHIVYVAVCSVTFTRFVVLYDTGLPCCTLCFLSYCCQRP